MLKNLGIKGRVLLLTLLPTSLMALVLGGYFTWMQQSDLQTQLMQRGEMIAEQLAPLVAPAMGHKNSELLERIATQSLEQPDVRAVTFLAPDRTPLAHAGPTMVTQTPSGDGTQMLRRSGSDATRYLLPVFGKHRNLAGDLIPDETDRLLGWVELELSHNSMLLRGYRSLFASLLMIAAGLSGAALLALRMGRTINRPLSQIKQAVAQLKDGHLETRLPPSAAKSWMNWRQGSTAWPAPCKMPRKNCNTASIRPPKTCARTSKPSKSRTSNSIWRARKRWRRAGSNPSSSPT